MMHIMDEKEKKDFYRRKNLQRAVYGEIIVYYYPGMLLGEPVRSKIESQAYRSIVLRTYRHDFADFIFIRSRINHEIGIFVLKFDVSGINRLSCEHIKKWDPRYKIVD